MIQNILIFIICSNVYLAQDFIDRFINHFSSLDTYSLEFDYVTKNQGEIVYSQKGSLFFSKSKFRIVLTDLIFLFDGENHYTIVPENKEINMSSENEIANYILPSKIALTISKIRDRIKIKKNKLFEISYEDESGNTYLIFIKNKNYELNLINVGRLRFELRTSRLKAGCSTAELATHFCKIKYITNYPF